MSNFSSSGSTDVNSSRLTHQNIVAAIFIFDIINILIEFSLGCIQMNHWMMSDHMRGTIMLGTAEIKAQLLKPLIISHKLIISLSHSR